MESVFRLHTMNISHRVFSSFTHGSLGHRHDPYVLGEFLRGPRHVGDLVLSLLHVAYLAQRSHLSRAD